MTYEPSLFTFDRVYGSARLGYTLVLGTTQLGQTVNARQHIPIAAVSVKDGYTIGDTGELSIDPATGSASMSTHGAPTGATLQAGNAVEAGYNGILIFAGSVTAVTVSMEADPAGGFVQQANYTLASRESILLATIETWNTLPQEAALSRLSRWFTVDTTGLADARLPWLDTLVPYEEAGSATLLDLARAFSSATKLPLRIRKYITGDMTSITVLDPYDPTATLTGTDAWAHAVAYQTSEGSSVLAPVSVDVTTDNTTLMGGYSEAGEVGFLAGDPINLFGWTVAVARVSQTFGAHYSASLELQPTTSATPTSNVETLSTAKIVGTEGNVGYFVTAYGAVPDGVTDSGAAINRAIAASPDRSGIIFPGGVYSIETPVLLRANRAYIGSGDVTLLQKANTDMDCLVKVDPDEPVPRRNIHWQGISLNGQAFNQFFDPSLPESVDNPMQLNNNVYRADSGFEINNGMMLAAVQFSNFYDLAIRNVGGTGLILRGIDFTGGDGEDDFNETTSTVHFVSPYIYAAGKYGVYFGDRTDDNHIFDGDIGACQYECVYMIAGSSSLRNTTVWGSKQANGILIGAPTNQVIGCQIEGHAQHGIKITNYGSYNYVSSNKIYYCSTQESGGYDGINIGSETSDHLPKFNTLIGNFIYAGIGDFFPTPADWVGLRHGICLDDNCSHTVVEANNVDLAPAGAQPNNTRPGVFGLKAGDTFNGVRYTDAVEDAARLASDPRGVVAGQPWFRDDLGLTYVWTGYTRDRAERYLQSKHDLDGGEFWCAEGITAMSIGLTQVRFDSTYNAIVTPGWNTTWWVYEFYTDQFTVGFGTPAPVGGARCGWVVVRHGE